MAEQLERAGSSPAELISLLQDYGYTLHESRRKRLLPLTELPISLEVIDVLYLPANSASR